MPTITFTDLVAFNALYRPGPMDWIPDFIARKQGEKPITYPIAETECFLSETYGLLVYQEQIMQLALLLAGFTLNESDRLRKSLFKKKVDRPQFKEKFISAATAKGYNRDLLELLWQDWDTKASCLFNKSHAVCYTLIAFQTAYLKSHFPTEYMAARLQYDLNNQDFLSDCELKCEDGTTFIGNELDKDLQECQRMDIQVMVLDHNHLAKCVSINKDGSICCTQT